METYDLHQYFCLLQIKDSLMQTIHDNVWKSIYFHKLFSPVHVKNGHDYWK